MDTRTLKFQVFRYHLLPLSTGEVQLSLFPNKTYSPKEIREKKNIFFSEVLNDLGSHIGSNPLKIEHSEGDYYLIKLAQIKTTTIVKNFEDIVVDNEPYVFIIINNNENVQKLAISHNLEAFTEPKVVKNILRKFFKAKLKSYGLNIEIEELFKKSGFWDYVRKHQGEITTIDFKYIKPNLAAISKSLSADFKKFTNSVNSHESHIKISAPKNGVLENISKDNKDIKGLVNYTSEGAGDIRLKIKGVQKMYSTKENPVIFRVDEATIEGSSEQVIKVYQSLISE